MRSFIFILFFLTTSLSYAFVYMEKNKKGQVTYSDTPLSKNEQIVTPSEVDYTSTPTSNPPSNIESPPKLTETTIQVIEKTPYQSFVITSPADGETIQNQPTLDVALAIDPALQKGDVVQIYVDGNPINKAEPTNHIQLGQLERGTHRLSAAILNSTGQIQIQAKPITIYVQRVSTILSPSFQK